MNAIMFNLFEVFVFDILSDYYLKNSKQESLCVLMYVAKDNYDEKKLLQAVNELG